jgi:UDP-N-acetylmuramoyl-L-alanyl-D-glutamate--2,6-diaminopimelate ligase
MKALLRSTFLYHWFKLTKAYVARWLYGHPSKDMVVIGITGTDGKTTTCNITHYLVNQLLGKAVVIGTTGAKIGLDRVEGVQKMTSYDPMDLQKLLATAYDAGCRYAVLEVSSHAMDQERFAGIDFDIAALTNITADHLDRHKTVDEYAKSKQKLFHALAQNRKGVAILPKDDSYGKKRFETMSFGKKIDYAVDTTALLSATDCVLDRDGSHAKIDYIGTE